MYPLSHHQKRMAQRFAGTQTYTAQHARTPTYVMSTAEANSAIARLPAWIVRNSAIVGTTTSSV